MPVPSGGDIVLRAGGSAEGTSGALRFYSGSSASAGKSGNIELTTPGNNQISGDVSVSSGDALVILHVYMSTTASLLTSCSLCR